MSDLISKSEYGKALTVKIETIRAKIKNCPNHFLAQSVINDWESEIEGLYDAAMLLDKAPTVDAVEVVHGEWISLTECANAGVYCSVCNKKVWKEDYALCNKKNKLRSNYCPNCGAKIDWSDDE